MTVFARRYDWRTSDPLDNVLLLDGLCEKPEFVAYPYSAEERRAIFAAMLTDPGNVIWTTYSGEALTGIIFLSRVVPRIDALLHFLFLDKNLVSKRNLLRNIIGMCFTDFGLNRLSMEVPEGVRLERFARSVLGFRYEGEDRPRNPEVPKSLSDTWLARQGSRRQGSHFDGAAWKDIVLLRLLASEWVGETGEREAECRGLQEQPHQ